MSHTSKSQDGIFTSVPVKLIVISKGYKMYKDIKKVAANLVELSCNNFPSRLIGINLTDVTFN